MAWDFASVFGGGEETPPIAQQPDPFKTEFSLDDLINGNLSIDDQGRVAGPSTKPASPDMTGDVMQSAEAAPGPAPGYSIDDLISGKVTVDNQGKATVHDTVPEPEDTPDPSGFFSWDTAYNTVMAGGQGVGSGVEVAGALAQLAMPELGDKVRKSGRSVAQYFEENMSPDWQEAVNKSWLDLSREGAGRDWRAWVAGLASTVPYMVGTGFAGEGAALGLRALGVVGKEAGVTVAERVASREAIKASSRKLGYMGAAGGAGAGESAAGAAAATDEAGLTAQEKEQAMWAAAPFGLATGVVVGPRLEKLLHGTGSSLAGRVAGGAVTEAIEEGGTQFGTEVGKATQKLGFDPYAIAESAVQGAALGGGAGAIIHRGKAGGEKRRREEEAAGTAEAQAILSEANRLRDEEMAGGRGVMETQEKARQGAPLALPSPDTIPPTDQQPGIGAVRQEAPAAAPAPNTVQPQPSGPIVAEGSSAALTGASVGAGGPMSQPTGAQPQAAINQDRYLFSTAEGQANFDRLETRVVEIGDKLTAIGEKLTNAQSARERTANRSKFVEARKQYQEAQRTLDDFIERQRKLMGKMQQQRLSGIVEEGTPGDINHASVGAMDQQELSDELDRWFGEVPKPRSQEWGSYTAPNEAEQLDQGDPEEPPLLKRITAAVKRSEAARRGHITRKVMRAKQAQSPIGAPQSQLDQMPAQPQAGPSASGSSEQQAIRSRTPSNNDRPSTTAAVQAATAEPEMAPPGSTPPGAGAATPQGPMAQAPGAPPGASPAAPGPVAPGGPQPPAAAGLPAQPQTQRGNVTLPTDDMIPTQAQLQRRDPASIIGDQPPASIMPQVEQALTKPKPRQKPLAELTPRERLAKVLLAGPRPIDSVLAAMQDAFNNDGDTRAFRLIQRLRTALPQTDAKGNPLGVVVENRLLSKGFQGLFDPRSNRIYIDMSKAEDSVTTLLHETVHAATIYKMRSNPSFAKDIYRIMDDARRSWVRYVSKDVGDDAAMHDPEEFIARILTDFEFQDKLGVLPASNTMHHSSVWMRLKGRIRNLMGVRADPSVASLFDVMMEFIPDGRYMQEGNWKELAAQLDERGLSQPVASLASGFRSMLRQPGATAVAASGGSSRVWDWQLPILTVQQIASTYGDLGKSYVDRNGAQQKLGDAINEYSKLNDIRDGYAESLRAAANQIISVGKEAANLSGGTKVLDDVLMDARLWSLDPDKPVRIADPSNLGQTMINPIQTGARSAGGEFLYAQLAARFRSLSPIQKDFYRLVRDNSAAQRYEHINQLMLWRVDARLGSTAAGWLQRMIYDPSRQVSNAAPGGAGPSGITITYQKPLSMSEVKAFVQGLGISPDQQARVYKDMRQVSRAIGQGGPVYIPLRRAGSHYAMISTGTRSLSTRPLTRAEYDQLVYNNRINQGDMVIDDDGEFAATVNGITTTLYRPTGRYTSVTAFDSEEDAKAEFESMREDFRQRGLTMDPSKSRYALKADNLYATLGVQSSTVQALRRNVEEQLSAKLGNNVGKAASDQIMTYYLERLPESSVRKSQLHARKIAGASRDTLHVYSQYSNGAAYISAQMKYGAQQSDMLNRQINEDVRQMQKDGAYEQASDLTRIQNFLKNREAAYNRLADKEATEISSNLMTWWRRAPQLVGAWLLTGPGTILTNSFQVWQLGMPYLAARYGGISASAQIFKAYTDVVKPIISEAASEGRRFAGGIPGALKVAAGRQSFTRSIHDPGSAMFRKAMAGLPANEQDMIRALALRKKIDFGLTADIKELANRASGRWMAVQYMMDGAFILPQAVETMNRMVMGLATARMARAQVAAQVNADQNIPAGEKAAKIEERLTDLAAEAIDVTQINYSAANRPSAFQSEVLRAALVFKTFPQSVWYTLMHNMVQMMHAKTPQEKWIAAKFVGGMFATTALSAGMMGMIAMDPFYLASIALIRGLTDDDDPEIFFRKAVHGFLGDWTDLAMRGVPYGFGLADTSNRMGLPTIFPVSDMMSRRKPGDNENAYASITAMIGEVILGAPGSLAGETLWPAGKAFWNGDYATGREKMMPKAFGLNDLVQAWNMSNQGLVDSKGNAYITTNDISLQDILTRVMGFDTTGIAQDKAVRRKYIAQSDALVSERNSLIADFAEAQMARDREGRSEVLQRIKQWNIKQGRRDPKTAIKRSTLERSLKTRTENAQNIAQFGARVQTPGQLRLLNQIKELYGA